ncbi:unnamed protein product [Brassica rapa]|uniref:Uncharacterized protein n=1 Tax=Brassica campestris TaxID=3711 RepID=A0A8D9LNU2_BRACM|nr:unnamed protein product [Brassica rapa]
MDSSLKFQESMSHCAAVNSVNGREGGHEKDWPWFDSSGHSHQRYCKTSATRYLSTMSTLGLKYGQHITS